MPRFAQTELQHFCASESHPLGWQDERHRQAAAFAVAQRDATAMRFSDLSRQGQSSQRQALGPAHRARSTRECASDVNGSGL